MVYNFVVHKVVNRFIVTYPFTFPTTKKDNLSRQMDDAGSEHGITLVSTFARQINNLKTDEPDGIELGGNEDEEKDTNCCSYSAYYIESLILFWT